MLGLRLPELLLILAVLLLVFGANKLPQLGAGLGKGIQSFKRAFSDARDEPEEKGSLPPGREAPPAPQAREAQPAEKPAAPHAK